MHNSAKLRLHDVLHVSLSLYSVFLFIFATARELSFIENWINLCNQSKCEVKCEFNSMRPILLLFGVLTSWMMDWIQFAYILLHVYTLPTFVNQFHSHFRINYLLSWKRILWLTAKRLCNKPFLFPPSYSIAHSFMHLQTHSRLCLFAFCWMPARPL
jgi:hypothetical protein